MLGEPICVRTLSSHCRGPFRCSSIQQGVLVTVCRLGETTRAETDVRYTEKGVSEQDLCDWTCKVNFQQIQTTQLSFQPPCKTQKKLALSSSSSKKKNFLLSYFTILSIFNFKCIVCNFYCWGVSQSRIITKDGVWWSWELLSSLLNNHHCW